MPIQPERPASRILSPTLQYLQADAGTRTPDPFITSSLGCRDVGSGEPCSELSDALRPPQNRGVRDMVRDTATLPATGPSDALDCSRSEHLRQLDAARLSVLC